MKQNKMLSESIADDLTYIIKEEKRFKCGDKLPNENELATEFGVSRTTIREAVRMLVTAGILEIQRGKGTFVTDFASNLEYVGLSDLVDNTANAKDLFEMRLIFEPENAYLAAKRATDKELEEILKWGNKIEEKILNGEDRTLEEQEFHKAIAKATHNEFMTQLYPILFESIESGVRLLQKNQGLSQHNMNDDKLLMDFLKNRNAEGARYAMKIHILHALEALGIKTE